MLKLITLLMTTGIKKEIVYMSCVFEVAAGPFLCVVYIINTKQQERFL